MNRRVATATGIAGPPMTEGDGSQQQRSHQ
jgi:hypothetical protein